MENITFKEYINRVLNGMSLGVIITLVPLAFIGGIGDLLNIVALNNIANITSKFLSVVIGLCIAMRFKLSPIQAGTISITTVIGSGAVKITDNVVTFVGMGDIINASLTAALAIYLVLIIGDKLKTYTVLVLPTLIITIVGLIGLFTLPYVSYITTYIGDIINQFTVLQPILMGILIAMSFSFLIASPISSVAVGYAIGLTGISSGAANLGATAACIGLGIYGLRANGLGTALATIFGSPKLQMANLVKKPKIILPVLLLGAFLGALSGIFRIQGTPDSAGFGIIGLIGPLKHLNIVGWNTYNIILTLLIFFIAPLILSIIIRQLVINKSNFLTDDDYKINI